MGSPPATGPAMTGPGHCRAAPAGNRALGVGGGAGAAGVVLTVLVASAPRPAAAEPRPPILMRRC